jgi:low temperature requirement protein LtrA
MARNYAQLTAWKAIAGVLFVIGAFAHGDARLAIWIAALVVEYGAPLVGFWLPGLGSTPMSGWTLAGGHLAERCQLVVLIALGETILAVGATFAGLEWHASVAAGFVAGFVGTVSLWWIYFTGHAEEGARAIADSADPARIGRAGSAYAHAVMVAGVIVVAVAIDLTIAHPTGSPGAATAPALYLAGNALFGFTLSGHVARSRVFGIAGLAALAPLAAVVSRLVLLAGAALVVLVLAFAAGVPASTAGPA